MWVNELGKGVSHWSLSDGLCPDNLNVETVRKMCRTGSEAPSCLHLRNLNRGSATLREFPRLPGLEGCWKNRLTGGSSRPVNSLKAVGKSAYKLADFNGGSMESG